MDRYAIEYKVAGVVYKVLLMRKEYAYAILRNLRKLPGATDFQVIGFDLEIQQVKSAR